MGNKRRKIQDKTMKNFVEINDLRVNMIDDYKCGMVGFDLNDKL